MNNLKSTLGVLMLVAVTGGCSSNVQTLVCEGAPNSGWYEEGYQTALKGKSIRTFDEHKKRCGSSLEATAKNSFIDGYTKGIIEFCTFEKGYELGLENSRNPETCPYEIRTAFNNGFVEGNRDYRETIEKLKKRARDYDDEQYRQSNADTDTDAAGI